MNSAITFVIHPHELPAMLFTDGFDSLWIEAIDTMPWMYHQAHDMFAQVYFPMNLGFLVVVGL